MSTLFACSSGEKAKNIDLNCADRTPETPPQREPGGVSGRVAAEARTPSRGPAFSRGQAHRAARKKRGPPAGPLAGLGGVDSPGGKPRSERRRQPGNVPNRPLCRAGRHRRRHQLERQLRHQLIRGPPAPAAETLPPLSNGVPSSRVLHGPTGPGGSPSTSKSARHARW